MKHTKCTQTEAHQLSDENIIFEDYAASIIGVSLDLLRSRYMFVIETIVCSISDIDFNIAEQVIFTSLL